jgi:hypothetical protein
VQSVIGGNLEKCYEIIIEEDARLVNSRGVLEDNIGLHFLLPFGGVATLRSILKTP